MLVGGWTLGADFSSMTCLSPILYHVSSPFWHMFWVLASLTFLFIQFLMSELSCFLIALPASVLRYVICCFYDRISYTVDPSTT